MITPTNLSLIFDFVFQMVHRFIDFLMLIAEEDLKEVYFNNPMWPGKVPML